MHLAVWAGVPVKQSGGAAGGKFLDLKGWIIAWDGYSLAAVAVGQMSYSCTRVHRETVLKLAYATGTATEKRGEALAVIYDRLVRSVV